MDMDGVISLLSDDENGISNVQHHGHQTRKRRRRNNDDDDNNGDDDNNDSDYEEGEHEEEEHDEIINNNSKPQKCVGLDDGPCTGYCALTFSGSFNGQCLICQVIDHPIMLSLYPSLGRIIQDQQDEPELIGGAYAVQGSLGFAEELQRNISCKHYPFDEKQLLYVAKELLRRQVFVRFSEASPNNRNSDTYSTGLLTERTEGILREYPIMNEYLNELAPAGKVKITSLWLTCSDKVSNSNPNGGTHKIHGDKFGRGADIRSCTSLSDSDEGKLMHFQHDDGRWVQFAADAGTTFFLDRYGAGVGDSPIKHGIYNGSEVWALLAELKIL